MRLYPDHAHAQTLGEDLHHLIALTQSQQSVIDEHAGQLLTDRPLQQRRHDRGVDAAREREQHAFATDLSANTGDQILDDVAGGPARFAAADFTHEALENRRTLAGVRDLGVELHAVVAAALVGHGRVRRIGSARDGLKPGGNGSTRSPWLIQTSSSARPSRSRSSSPSNSRHGALTATSA